MMAGNKKWFGLAAVFAAIVALVTRKKRGSGGGSGNAT